jgi:hypothetical protein
VAILCLAFAACKKPPEDEVVDSTTPTPLYLGSLDAGPTSVSLSYDAIIHRVTTFHNGITQSSPGWKKLQAVPETESYSYQLNVGSNGLYMLKDDIVMQSVMHDRIPLSEKIAKIEVVNDISTSYDALDNVISIMPTGDLAQNFLGDLAGLDYLSPIDTTALATQGINYAINGNTLTIVNLIAKGDDNNSTVLLDKGTGLPLLMMFYDDNDLTKLTMMVSHQYNAANKLTSSMYTYYDFLSDGDMRQKVERWTYANYSLLIQ